jgi:hypothetical protein
VRFRLEVWAAEREAHLARLFRRHDGLVSLCGEVQGVASPSVPTGNWISTSWQYWNNPTGWLEIIRFLKDSGYRVICIDQKPVHGTGLVWNHIPNGAEDETGDRPLTERARPQGVPVVSGQHAASVRMHAADHRRARQGHDPAHPRLRRSQAEPHRFGRERETPMTAVENSRPRPARLCRERVPDAVQRERAPEKVRDAGVADCAREWWTADPGPPEGSVLGGSRSRVGGAARLHF